MKFPILSIRTRILLWHGVMLACILTAFGITAHRLNWENELARLDGILAEPISLLHRSLRDQNNRGRPGEGFRTEATPPPESFALPPDVAAQFESHHWQYRIWNRHGRLVHSSDGLSQNSAMPSAEGIVPFVAQRRSIGMMREAYIFTPVGDCLLASISMTEAMQSASRFGWQMFALGAIVLGFGLLVDAWILRRAIRPVELIISAAERISQGNLSTRIETEHSSQELGRLTSVLNSTFASLDQAFTQQARFSADVAHELRTPVSVLITESQISLERERSTDDYRDTISTCLRSARRMGGLIESLLDLAQIQSAHESTHSACDLSTLTSDVILNLQALANTHGIDLRTSLSPAPCRGNAEQLTQIITNLISNAIQHNHRGGHALIETSQEADHATLRVSNTGPGIPAADLPHIFERFYRTDTSRNRKTGGAGLGLAISKAIADAHGAKLSVTSTSTEGTTLILSLPTL
jgi:two-component system, OmpR family, sensor kinase